MNADNSVKEAIKEAKKRKDWTSCIRLCKEALRNAPESAIEETYSLKLNLAFALIEERDNSRGNCEEAIAIYEGLLSYVESLSNRWTSLHRNLGYTYSARLEGNRDNNLLTSIHHYEQALKGMERNGEAELKASISSEMGFAFMELRTGKREKNIEQAKQCFRDALAVFTEMKHPEEWREISSALASLEEETGTGTTTTK